MQQTAQSSVLLRQRLAQVTRHAILDELLSLEILGHRKAGVQLCLNGILAQNAAAQTVNRGNLRTLKVLQLLAPEGRVQLILIYLFADALADTRLHLACRLTRKGNRQDIRRLQRLFLRQRLLENIHKASHEHLRLAAACACRNSHVAVNRFYRLLLLVCILHSLVLLLTHRCHFLPPAPPASAPACGRYR